MLLEFLGLSDTDAPRERHRNLDRRSPVPLLGDHSSADPVVRFTPGGRNAIFDDKGDLGGDWGGREAPRGNGKRQWATRGDDGRRPCFGECPGSSAGDIRGTAWGSLVRVVAAWPTTLPPAVFRRMPGQFRGRSPRNCSGIVCPNRGCTASRLNSSDV